MSEKLRLKKTGSKMRIRLNIVALLVIILVSIGIGYVLGEQQLTITGKAVQDNCIPEEDLQYFINQVNDIQADYQKCVSDLWEVSFICSQANAASNQNE